MVTAQDIYRIMNEVAPFSLAENWDNVGYLVEGTAEPIDRVLLSLDVTHSVVDEAIEKGVQLLISHHPVIFQPLKRIAGNSIVSRLVRAEIGVISAHTNLDIAQGGVNDALAVALGLRGLRPLQTTSKKPWYKVGVTVNPDAVEAVYDAMTEAGAGVLGNYSHCGFLTHGEGRFQPREGANPHIGAINQLEQLEEIRLEMLVAPDRLDAVLFAMKQAHPYEVPAFDVYHNYALEDKQALGRVGMLEQPLTPDALAALVKERLAVAGVKYAPGTASIDTVAVCGGSGAELLELAKSAGAQALITGESRHHLLLSAQELGITLIDAGHFATETVVLEPLRHILQKRIPSVKIEVAKTNGDGVKYL